MTSRAISPNCWLLIRNSLVIATLSLLIHVNSGRGCTERGGAYKFSSLQLTVPRPHKKIRKSRGEKMHLLSFRTPATPPADSLPSWRSITLSPWIMKKVKSTIIAKFNPSNANCFIDSRMHPPACPRLLQYHLQDYSRNNSSNRFASVPVGTIFTPPFSSSHYRLLSPCWRSRSRGSHNGL